MSILSERLRELTKANKFLKKQVAEGSKIPLRTYHRYETGEREPPASALVAMADFFNVSLDYLVGRTDNPKMN